MKQEYIIFTKMKYRNARYSEIGRSYADTGRQAIDNWIKDQVVDPSIECDIAACVNWAFYEESIIVDNYLDKALQEEIVYWKNRANKYERMTQEAYKENAYNFHRAKKAEKERDEWELRFENISMSLVND